MHHGRSSAWRLAWTKVVAVRGLVDAPFHICPPCSDRWSGREPGLGVGLRAGAALAVAWRTSGEGAVARHGGVPPYAETLEYVRRILSFYPSARHVFPGDGAMALATTGD